MGVFHEFGTVRPSVRNASQKWRVSYSGSFCMKLVVTKKMTNTNFWKKSPSEIWDFWNSVENLIHSCPLCSLEFESVRGQVSVKTACLGEIWFLSYDAKTSRPIKMMDSLTSITSSILKVATFKGSQPKKAVILRSSHPKKLSFAITS